MPRGRFTEWNGRVLTSLVLDGVSGGVADSESQFRSRYQLKFRLWAAMEPGLRQGRLNQGGNDAFCIIGNVGGS